VRTEVVKVGSRGAYAVDLIIGNERFRIKYFVAHRVDPLKDAREFVQKIDEAIKKA